MARPNFLPLPIPLSPLPLPPYITKYISARCKDILVDLRLTALAAIDQNIYMSKLTPPVNDVRSRSWQLLPYTLLGAVLFAWVSSAHLNNYFAVYLVLLAAQLGTVGIYFLMRRLKSKHRRDL
jgi:hypothetical protein